MVVSDEELFNVVVIVEILTDLDELITMVED